jgi:hypothetical protein
MFMRATIFFCLGCLLSFAACQKNKTSKTAAEPVDVCALLSAQEIQEVQGAPLKEAKKSEQSNGRVRVAQCYFAADPANRSVSLAITQNDRGSNDTDAVREFWRQMFSGSVEKNNESAEDREKRESLREIQRGEEGTAPMKKIEGIGEDAYWSGSAIGGALYVLKGPVYIRISVGGPDNEEAKIDKSKKLAQQVLARL